MSSRNPKCPSALTRPPSQPTDSVVLTEETVTARSVPFTLATMSGSWVCACARPDAATCARSFIPLKRGNGPLAKVGILLGDTCTPVIDIVVAIALAGRFCLVESPSTADVERSLPPVPVALASLPVISPEGVVVL